MNMTMYLELGDEGHTFDVDGTWVSGGDDWSEPSYAYFEVESIVCTDTNMSDAEIDRYYETNEDYIQEEAENLEIERFKYEEHI